MLYTTATFGDRLAFIFEKRNEAYIAYDDVSIAKEKADVTQKILQRKQLGWLAGRNGVCL